MFFEGAHEALGTAVPLRFADEGGAAGDTRERQLGLVVVAQELAAVVVTKRQAGDDVLGIAAEDRADALAERLERREAGATTGGVDADAPGGEVVDGGRREEN